MSGVTDVPKAPAPTPAGVSAWSARIDRARPANYAFPCPLRLAVAECRMATSRLVVRREAAAAPITRLPFGNRSFSHTAPVRDPFPFCPW